LSPQPLLKNILGRVLATHRIFICNIYQKIYGKEEASPPDGFLEVLLELAALSDKFEEWFTPQRMFGGKAADNEEILRGIFMTNEKDDETFPEGVRALLIDLIVCVMFMRQNDLWPTFREHGGVNIVLKFLRYYSLYLSLSRSLRSTPLPVSPSSSLPLHSSCSSHTI